MFEAKWYIVTFRCHRIEKIITQIITKTQFVIVYLKLKTEHFSQFYKFYKLLTADASNGGEVTD